ncbi:MAG: chorion class high-cysteine HCB protein 13 [Clostridiales bacterium]|nr:chorion class high-cysteine HCB protein 13 [Oscillospiraceae bacterium]MBE7074010.1 chorion class high-cysteine HCB protein 13 [Clostridiales bacterium]
MNFFNNNTGCGGNFDHCGCGCDICSIVLWIILLQCLCGGNNGCGIDCCTLIILLLLCGCGNNHCK